VLPESLITTRNSNETTVHILTDTVLTNHSDATFGENTLLTSGSDITLGSCTTGTCVIPSADPASITSSGSQTKTTPMYSVIPSHLLPQCDNDRNALEKTILLSNFERWLASVNERINGTMNYKLSGKPESLVYYVCHVSKQSAITIVSTQNSLSHELYNCRNTSTS
jgi:hypothetical protein